MSFVKKLIAGKSSCNVKNNEKNVCMRDLVFQSVSTPTLAKDYFFKKVKKHDKLT